MVDYDSKAIESKWQDAWYGQKIFEPKVGRRPKWYMVFAYPTVSGTLHVGHARSYCLPDAVARYKRMAGHNVFFPLGFHATGVDCLTILEKSKADPVHAAQHYGMGLEATQKFQAPLDVAEYLQGRIITAFRRMGLSLDTRTAVSTIHPHYNKFVQWQYRRLAERPGYIVQKDYVLPFCTKCGHPVSLDAAEADIAAGGEAQIKEYQLIQFRDSAGAAYPAATLRPETVSGVTQIWVSPQAEYVEAKIDGQTWWVAFKALQKLRDLGRAITDEKAIVLGQQLVGRKVKNPVTEKEIEIQAATFVDANEATGIVMSVPAHDPFDYTNFIRAGGKEENIPLVMESAEPGVPAGNMLKKFNGDEMKAQTELYGLEYRARVRPEVPVIGGMLAPQAKETISKWLSERGLGDAISEFTIKPLYCRCGGELAIKKIDKQWFVNYADPGWKAVAKQAVEQMTTWPPEYKKELPGIIDWMHERPLTRKQGLGTPFPFESGWVIEAISDSTIYMAFYFVSKAVNEGKLKLEEIDDALFDYIYYGKRKRLKCDRKVAREIRKEYEHFYPLDVNFAGKEHKSVHFPAFIFQHAALFPQAKWPKGIFVNWHLGIEGEKLSKSKGNVVFWDDAIAKWGADGVRLYITEGANQWADFDWRAKDMEAAAAKIPQIFALVGEYKKRAHKRPLTDADRWMLSRLHSAIKTTTAHYEAMEMRNTVAVGLHQLWNDLRWYLRRGSRNQVVVNQVIESLVKMIAPVCPHLAEEMWAATGHKGLVVQSDWPVADETLISPAAEAGEQFVRAVMDDVAAIRKVAKITPTRIALCTAADWKWAVSDAVLKACAEKPDMAAAMSAAMAVPGVDKAQAADFVKVFFKRAVDMKGRAKMDEAAVLSGAKEFLAKELGLQVDVWVETDPAKWDPANKAFRAQPGKPAIYMA